MATIDPSIAMGYKPIQIENPLNQLAAYSQIQSGQQNQQLNALKIREAEQGIENRNALRNLDPNDPDYISKIIRIDPALGLEFQTKQAAAKTSGLQATKLQTETEGLQFKQRIDKANKALADISALNTPQEALEGIAKHLASGDIDQVKADNLRKSIAMAPSFRDWQKSTLVGILDAKDRIVTTETARSNAEKERIAAEQLGVSKGQLGVAQGTLDVSRQGLANETNPVLLSNIAEAKAAGEFLGKNKAAAAQALPAALENATQAIRLIDEMVGTAEVRDKNGKVIKAAGKEHPGFSNYVGVGFPTRFVEGSDAASFEIRQKQIEGKAFLEAFNTLRGGGAITEKEGEKGTLAIMRMNKATSEAEYKAAARELQEVLRTGVNTMRAKAGQPSGGGGTAPRSNATPASAKPSLNDIFNPQPQ
jgi:hypothetical protein